MGNRRPALIIAACIAVFLAGVLTWALSSSGRQAKQPAILGEITDQSGIQSNVNLSHISIATSENYFGHKIRLIHGVLKNVSDKPLRSIDVKMMFTDDDGKSIQESTHKAYEITQKPLEPGREYRFEIGFENLPPNWNYRVPVTEVVKVVY